MVLDRNGARAIALLFKGKNAEVMLAVNSAQLPPNFVFRRILSLSEPLPQGRGAPRARLQLGQFLVDTTRILEAL